jgi:AcrR family transcriptional regulator
LTELLTARQARPSAKRTQTRERLMQAAIGVFAERGIIGSSVEEICESAGFTRGAFYSNFSDKDELVVALLRHEIDIQYSAAEEAIRAMKAAARPGLGAEELVSVGLTAFEEAGRMGRDWLLTQQELLLYSARVPTVRDAYRKFSEECLKQFSSLVVDAVGYAGREFTVSFEEAITLLSATHGHVHLEALLSGTELDSRPLQVLLLAITQPLEPGH